MVHSSPSYRTGNSSPVDLLVGPLYHQPVPRSPRFPAFLLLSLTAASAAAAAQQGWWMNEPIRWVQTNLRATDASLDARHLVDQLADMRANVLHFGMGGIAAFYPTQVPFHYPSSYLPPGRDMFG